MQTKLSQLKEYLADPNQWPHDFEWEYRKPTKCAHGLATKLFPEIKWGVYDRGENADFFGITEANARYIFNTPTELPYDGEETNEWDAVTPAEVISRINKVLAKQ